MGRNEVNIHGNKIINDKLSTGLYLHANKNTSINDKNSDGFLDNPTSNAFNIFNLNTFSTTFHKSQKQQ